MFFPGIIGAKNRAKSKVNVKYKSIRETYINVFSGNGALCLWFVLTNLPHCIDKLYKQNFLQLD